MHKRTILKRLLPILMLVVLSVLVGVTGATVLHNVELENPIKTPPVEGDVKEDLDGDAKNAKFINTGEADVFLRVAYTETWIAEDGTILPNMTKNAAGTLVSPAKPNWDKSSGVWDWSKEGTEGWIYYNKVLPGAISKLDNKSTNYIVTDVDFSNVTKDVVVDPRYKKAKYRLHFTMEVVQASDDWNVSKNAVHDLFSKSISSSGSDWKTEKYTTTITWN